MKVQLYLPVWPKLHRFFHGTGGGQEGLRHCCRGRGRAPGPGSQAGHAAVGAADEEVGCGRQAPGATMVRFAGLSENGLPQNPMDYHH